MLFDHGRRPSFQTLDGRLTDPDPFDHLAYHLVARSDDGLVGCLRIVPLKVGPPLSESNFGNGVLQELLDRLQCSRLVVAEVGRWLVREDMRRKQIGMRLVAGGGGFAAIGVCTRGGVSRYALSAGSNLEADWNESLP